MVTRVVVAVVVFIVADIVNVVVVGGGGGFIFVQYSVVLEDITSLGENGSHWRLWKIHTCIHTQEENLYLRGKRKMCKEINHESLNKNMSDT